MFDTETKEVMETALEHQDDAVRRFYAALRSALQSLREKLRTQINTLDQQVAREAKLRPQAQRLLPHPGVGPVTALATEVFLGDPARFANGKALASYVGMIPREYSSGDRQRLGSLSKQGNPLLRFLWVEAAWQAVRKDAALGRFYRRKLVVQKGFAKAVAAGRKLGIRLWIMLREQIDYEEFCRRDPARQKSGGARAGVPGKGYGRATLGRPTPLEILPCFLSLTQILFEPAFSFF